MIACVARSISAVILISVVSYTGYLFREVLLASPLTVSVVCAMASIIILRIFGAVASRNITASQGKRGNYSLDIMWE